MKLIRLFHEEDGQGLTEYALIVAALAIFAGVAASAFGNKISNYLYDINFTH